MPAAQVSAATRALNSSEPPFAAFRHLCLERTLSEGRKWKTVTEYTALDPRLGASYGDIASALQVILTHSRYDSFPDRPTWPRSVTGYQALLGEYELAIETAKKAALAAPPPPPVAAAVVPHVADVVVVQDGEGVPAGAGQAAYDDGAGSDGGESTSSGFMGRNEDLAECSEPDAEDVTDDDD